MSVLLIPNLSMYALDASIPYIELIFVHLIPFFAASKFAPKKWGLSGSSSLAMIAFLGGTSFLLSQGIDIRPNLAAILGLAFVDSTFLGGCCLAQLSSYWPPNRRRILVHEAGHLLTGKCLINVWMFDYMPNVNREFYLEC